MSACPCLEKDVEFHLSLLCWEVLLKESVKGVSLGNMGDVSSRSAMSECAGASLSLSEENSLILTILSFSNV